MQDIIEQSIKIRSSDGVVLVAHLHRGKLPRIVLLCHPHPLYGGAMDNNVVCAARDQVAAYGASTLRFNFRGVGASTGGFDEGRGEKRDLEACFSYAEELDEGRLKIDLVAYSFGAWVGANALSRGLRPATVTLVAPPTDFMSFEGFSLPALPKLPILVISGELDQYGSVASVDRWLSQQPESLGVERVVLEGVDHFCLGAEDQLKASLKDFYEKVAHSE